MEEQRGIEVDRNGWTIDRKLQIARWPDVERVGPAAVAILSFGKDLDVRSERGNGERPSVASAGPLGNDRRRHGQRNGRWHQAQVWHQGRGDSLGNIAAPIQ